MNTEKKPLYRKVSKTTHNGFPHANYDSNPRSRQSRHTKKGMKRGMNTQEDRRGHGVYDYTPLFMFLLKQEGRDWDEVWKECNERLNTTDPVRDMVVNVYKNGLVNPNYKPDYEASPGTGFNGKHFYPGKYFCYGEGSSFSTMYVDENNKLQFVDKNFKCGPSYEVERRWGETFNGQLYETYKRPEAKVKKMKSYIKK